MDRIRTVTGYPGDRAAAHEEFAQLLVVAANDETHVTVEHDLGRNLDVDLVLWHARTVPRKRLIAVDVWKTPAVRFTAEHHFSSTVQAVAEVLLDADFHAHLVLPDVTLPEVIFSERTGSIGTLRLRYEFVGHLDPIARRLVGTRALTWVQELQLDAVNGRGTLSIAVDGEPDRVRGHATVAIEPVATGSARRIAGDLQIRVPLVGGTAERRIVPGIVSRLDMEATAARSHLGEHTESGM